MSDETDSIADALRDSLHTSFQTHELAVEVGTSLRNDDGTPANFATAWIVSRLLEGGYADAFSLSGQTWMRAEFAEEVREYIEDELVESFDDEHGPLGLELAFLALEQVDWVAVALVLRRQMLERREAAKRLEHGDNAIMATITSTKVDPKEMVDEHGNFRFPKGLEM